MPCYHPIPAWKSEGGVFFVDRGDGARIDLPCGQCIGCRLRRSQDWSLRIMHEASMWKENCFVTLTYGRDKLPALGSLCYADYQLFMRRLRWFMYPARPRFFMCGEYGPVNFRPHYHACLFNIDFKDLVPRGISASGHKYYSSVDLEDLWGHGNVSVQPLVKETASYCAKYIVGKVTGDAAEARYRVVDADGVISYREPEFCRCSLKPGIGASWFARYGGDVYPHDFVVAGGEKFSPPRYYDRLKWREKSLVLDEIEYARQKRAKAAFADNTPERLSVREVVHKARVSRQERTLDE